MPVVLPALSETAQPWNENPNWMLHGEAACVISTAREDGQCVDDLTLFVRLAIPDCDATHYSVYPLSGKFGVESVDEHWRAYRNNWCGRWFFGNLCEHNASSLPLVHGQQRARTEKHASIWYEPGRSRVAAGCTKVIDKRLCFTTIFRSALQFISKRRKPIHNI